MQACTSTPQLCQFCFYSLVAFNNYMHQLIFLNISIVCLNTWHNCRKSHSPNPCNAKSFPLHLGGITERSHHGMNFCPAISQLCSKQTHTREHSLSGLSSWGVCSGATAVSEVGSDTTSCQGHCHASTFLYHSLLPSTHKRNHFPC